MPPKAKRKKGHKSNTTKMSQSGTSLRQNVYVSISKKTSVSRPKSEGKGFSNINKAPPILSQSFNPMITLQPPQITPPPYVEQYNSLLKAMQDERKQMLASLPVLASNTTPLTQNLQRNQLLNKPVIPNPLTEVTQQFSESLSNSIASQTYDDPTTNEEQAKFPAREAESIAPTLPVGRYDIEDVNEYDNSNNDEEEALAVSASKGEQPKTNAYGKRQILYEEYKEMIDSAYLQYPELRDKYKIKTIKQLNSQGKIKNEMEKIQQYKQLISQSSKSFSKSII